MLCHFQFHFMFTESAFLDSPRQIFFWHHFWAYIKKLVKVFLRLLHIHSLNLYETLSWFQTCQYLFFYITLFFLLWRVRVIFFREVLQAPLPGIFFQASDTHLASFDVSASLKVTTESFQIPLLQWFVD